jgi:hypothetical protein|tara:strand:+ start:39864 stop:40271 length:408 start_codon:yes stop_codon:yes gene_type:complete
MELSDLIDMIGETLPPEAESLDEFYLDLRDHPEDYRLVDLGQNIELRQIGKDIIPKKGISFYSDDELFGFRGRDFQKRYPELKGEDTRKALVEIVSNVSLKDVNLEDAKSEIEITIDRYLIQPVSATPYVTPTTN